MYSSTISHCLYTKYINQFTSSIRVQVYNIMDSTACVRQYYIHVQCYDIYRYTSILIISIKYISETQYIVDDHCMGKRHH